MAYDAMRETCLNIFPLPISLYEWQLPETHPTTRCCGTTSTQTAFG